MAGEAAGLKAEEAVVFLQRLGQTWRGSPDGGDGNPACS